MTQRYPIDSEHWLALDAVIGTNAAAGQLPGAHIDLAMVPVNLLPEWD